MAYDELLAARIRSHLSGMDGVVEKKMFGGLAFMLNGNMCCGVVKETLMLRVGKDQVQDVLDRPHARPMDFTGRPMKSMVYVDPAGFGSDEALATWLELAIQFVQQLPAK